MTSTAIVLWVIYAIVDVLLLIIPSVHFVLSGALLVANVSVFVAAVIYTVKEEKARHNSGLSGLGPAGIVAVVITMSLLVLNTAISYAVGFVVFNKLNKAFRNERIFLTE